MKRHKLWKGTALASSLVFIGAMVGLTAVLSTGGAAVASGNTHYYLALGDSLSVGWQPYGKASLMRAHVTAQGYTNDVEKVYAKQLPGLTLEELGCPGETTGTMINGDCSGGTVYSEGNQLAQAENFLENNHVSFVTIDIGANDVDGCVSDLNNQPALEACVEAGITTIETNLPVILSGLEAADTQGAPIYGMNLYDPFLATYLEGGTHSGPTGSAEQSVTLADAVNSALAATFAAATTPVPTADVALAFNTETATVPTSYTPPQPGGFGSSTDPLNVQAICHYTWECGGYENIHANKAGYAAIALAFEATIGYLG